jgi:hypothetical protein
MEAIFRFDGLYRPGVFLQHLVQDIFLPAEKVIELFSLKIKEGREPGGEQFLQLLPIVLVKDLHGPQTVSAQQIGIHIEKFQIGLNIIERSSLPESCRFDIVEKLGGGKQRAEKLVAVGVETFGKGLGNIGLRQKGPVPVIVYGKKILHRTPASFSGGRTPPKAQCRKGVPYRHSKTENGP